MKENLYTLISKRDDSVVIKINYGKSSYYPYNETFGFLEVSGDFDRSTFLVTEFHYRLMGHEKDTLANWQGREQAINYTSQESIEKAEELLRKQVKHLRAVIRDGKLHPAYSAMLPHAKEIIKHYSDDFYFWDAIALARENPAFFIWIVRTCGSQLYTSKSAMVETCIKFYADKRNSDEREEFYFWDGMRLHNIPANLAVSYMERMPAFIPQEG
jgi:hypothetical protein